MLLLSFVARATLNSFPGGVVVGQALLMLHVEPDARSISYSSIAVVSACRD